MQRYFNTLFFTLVPFVLGLFSAYLVGSFVCVSFDPSMWDFNDRMTTAGGGILWSVALYMKLTFEGLV